ncbi:MAG: hypothetical protein JEY99_19130 [Spirochaetales bacterium]|nr:hypothetical protein [Spirochaetales bacterium]
MKRVGKIVLLLSLCLPLVFLTAETDPNADDDGDGLTNEQEYDIWLTNPQDTDTDGDGWSDFQEVQLFDPNVDPGYFNPVVADMPKINIILKSEPQISMEFQTAAGTSESYSSERSNEFASSHTRSQSTSRTTGRENSYTTEFSATVEASVSLTDFGVSGSATATSSNTSSSYSEDSYSFGSDATKENRQMASQGRSKSQDNSVTNSGGEINYAVAFINPTGIAYEVESLTLATYKINPRVPNGLEMIGALSQETAFHTFQNFSIGPFSETPVMSFENGGLYVSDVLSLLEDSTGIQVVISSYKLTMDGKRFDSANTMVTAKTARINLDFDGFGGYYPESYQVSVKTLFNPDYRSSRDMFDTVTMADIFSYLYIDAARNEGKVREYNYYEGEHDGNEGLVNLRGVGATDTSYWVISHTGKRRGREFSDFYSTDIESYSLEDIEVLAGDVVDVFYIEDADQDGLSLRKERILGSSDETAHSDGDGLDDYTEYLIGSSPVLEDTDNDGYPDNEDPAPASAEILGRFTSKRLVKSDSRIYEHSDVGNQFMEEDYIVSLLYTSESGPAFVKVSDDFSSIIWFKTVDDRVYYKDFLPVADGYLVCGTLPKISSGPAGEYYPGYIALYSREGQKIWAYSSSDSEGWDSVGGNKKRPFALAEAESGNYYMLTEENGLSVWEIDPQGNFLQMYKGADIFSRTASSKAVYDTENLGYSYQGTPFFFDDYNGKPLLVFKDHLFLFDGDYAEYRNLGSYIFEGLQAFPLITESGQLFLLLSHGMDGGMVQAVLLNPDLSTEWVINRSLNNLGTSWVWEEDGQFKAILRGNMMIGGGSAADKLYLAIFEDGQLVSNEVLDWKTSDFYNWRDNYSNWATSGFEGFTDHGGYLFKNNYDFYFTDKNGNIPLR